MQLRLIFATLALGLALFHGWLAHSAAARASGLAAFASGAIVYGPLALAAVLGLVRRQGTIGRWSWLLLGALYAAAVALPFVGITTAGSLMVMAHTVLSLCLLGSVAMTPQERDDQWP